MKFLAKIVIFSLCIANLHGELLIIKRVQPQAFNHSNRSSFIQYFAPLDASDESNYPAIAQVLLNYQWPMVIANPNLTPAEQDELLTADVPNAEENFIRRKLQAINPAYDVAFIPTCLYELFVLQEINNFLIYDKDYYNPAQYSSLSLMQKFNVYLNSFTNTPLNTVRLKVEKSSISPEYDNTYTKYNESNDQFYPDAFLYINNRFIKALQNEYPKVLQNSRGFIISESIKNESHHLAAWLIHKGKININIFQQPFVFSTYINIDQELSLQDSTTLNKNKILSQVISLEYQARSFNKAILLRGSNQFDIMTNIKSNDTVIRLADNSIKIMQLLPSLTQIYKNGDKNPGSLSYGNSLFAGYVRDIGACAYLFINRCNGYGLFINKKDQIQHQSNNLFFISPLSSISALFAEGEYFHSRAKTAKPKTNEVQGLKFDLNPISKKILTINRNPLVHAQLFSQYLADNMVIIATPGHETSDLTLAEQVVYDQKKIEESDQLRANQAKAADYYGAIKKLGDHLPVATRNYRQKIDDEKALTEAIQKIEDKHGKSSMETELS